MAQVPGPGQRNANGIEYAHFRPIERIRRQVCVPEFRHSAAVLARGAVGWRFTFFGCSICMWGPCRRVAQVTPRGCQAHGSKRRHLAISPDVFAELCGGIAHVRTIYGEVFGISGVRRNATIARSAFQRSPALRPVPSRRNNRKPHNRAPRLPALWECRARRRRLAVVTARSAGDRRRYGCATAGCGEQHCI